MDFSGAVGGPFVVQWVAEPTAVTAEEPLTLTLRITGPGNLQDLPRPALGKLDSFKPFAVEDLDDRFVPGDPPRREFRYRVRPRSAGVTEVPRFKFVYFNPRLPAARGYQTTYADPVPLVVKPRTPARTVPAEVPAWMLEPPTEEELFRPRRQPWQDWLDWFLERNGIDTDEPIHGAIWFFAAMVFLPPPILAWLWLWVWRRHHPDAARLAAGRRSRAAAVALRVIQSAGGRADTIATALTGYLRDRLGLPAAASTPAEIAAALGDRQCPAPLTAATVELLRRCDAVRFAPATEDATLADDAARIVLEWETAV